MKIRELLPVLQKEFGATKIIGVALFGSHATNTAGPFSDRDLVIVADGLSPDIPTREKASPRLKHGLMSDSALYAFNIYSPNELDRAARNRSWLIETIRVGYEVLFDPHEFLTPLLGGNSLRVQCLCRLAWRDASCGVRADFVDSTRRSMRAADVLFARYPRLASFHMTQALLTQLHGALYECGIVATCAPFGDLLRMALLARAVRRCELAQMRDVFVRNEIAWRGRVADENLHICAARVLRKVQLPLEALAHVKAALHLAYGRTVSALGLAMTNGELTQMFLKTVGPRLPTQVRQLIEVSSYKIEQIDGRRCPPSFELTREGEPFYEAHAPRPEVYEALLRNGIAIVRELRAIAPILITS